MEQRLTYLSKDYSNYLELILNAPFEQIRIFLMIINQLQIKNRIVEKDSADNSYNGIEYISEEENIIEIPYRDFRKAIKQKYSYNDLIDLIENTLVRFDCLIEKYQTDLNTICIEFKEKYVLDRGGTWNSLLTPTKTFDHFIIVDLRIVYQLRSKYELFIYLKIMEFQKNKVAWTSINEIRYKLKTNAESRGILRKINKAVDKLNNLLNLNITVTVIRHKRNISSLQLKF